MSVITNGLTEQEDLQLQQLLKKWRDAGCGILSDETFTAIAQAIPQPCVEVLVFRKNVQNSKLEILALNRPPDDIIWPGKINFPGKAMRVCDFDASKKTPLERVIERIEEKELQNKLVEEPKFCGTWFGNSERGPGLCFCYIGKLSGDAIIPNYAAWRDIDDLKSDTRLIKSERSVLDFVLKHLK